MKTVEQRKCFSVEMAEFNKTSIKHGGRVEFVSAAVRKQG